MPERDPRGRRALLAALPHPLAMAPTVAALIVFADRLPEPMASHFGFSGAADGSAPRGTLVLMTAALGIGMGLLFWFMCRQGGGGSGAAGDATRRAVVTAWASAGFLGVVLFSLVPANLDRADAADAALPGWVWPAAVLAGVAGGAAGWFLAPRARPRAGGTAPASPSSRPPGSAAPG